MSEKTVSQTNHEWFSRASKVIPGGVDSPVRSFKSVGGVPFTVESGNGAYVTDVEGNRYIDLVSSYGAILLGHAHDVPASAVRNQLATGSTFGMPTRGETLLAETMTSRIKGLDQVRFVSSGTEATMSAIRVARGFTGRDRIIVFSGCYHGHSDGLLAAAGSGVATLGLAASAGVPSSAVSDTMVVPYNEIPEIDESVAAVVVEAAAANMNLVTPQSGFLADLRAACTKAGALLIFDEVITGFRLGYEGASGFFGIQPDLWCFGKVIGGGLPIGAFGGSAEILSCLAPLGPVYQAGTLSGNPLATAAGRAVLDYVTPAHYKELAARVERFQKKLGAALIDGGLSVALSQIGTLMGLYVGAPGSEIRLPRNFEESKALASNGIYAKLFHALLARGVAMAPGPYEIAFVSMAHDDAILDTVVDRAGDAAREVAQSL